MESIFDKNAACKNCIHSYAGASGGNCPSIVIKEYGLPLHCIVDGYDNINEVYENLSCKKFDEK